MPLFTPLALLNQERTAVGFLMLRDVEKSKRYVWFSASLGCQENCTKVTV